MDFDLPEFDSNALGIAGVVFLIMVASLFGGIVDMSSVSVFVRIIICACSGPLAYVVALHVLNR